LAVQGLKAEKDKENQHFHEQQQLLEKKLARKDEEIRMLREQLAEMKASHANELLAMKTAHATELSMLKVALSQLSSRVEQMTAMPTHVAASH